MVKEANQQRDRDSLSHARKTMVMIGLFLNTNGLRELEQLTLQLQEIMGKHIAESNAAYRTA